MIRLIGAASFATVLLCALASCGGGSKSGSGGGGGSGPTTETSAHPPLRTRYLRTDLQYNPNALQFFPPHVTAYDSVHKRFFISNTTLNRIEVFDAKQESQIGTIIVPEPWGMDISPDGSKLYVATTFGDVYLIDPGAMQVLLQRFPSSTIGPQRWLGGQQDGLCLLYATFGQCSAAFHKLDTSTGSITDFSLIEDVGANGDDAFIRVLLSPDGSEVYLNEDGHAWILDTSNDSLSAALQVTVDGGSVEMAISGDGSNFGHGELLDRRESQRLYSGRLRGPGCGVPTGGVWTEAEFRWKPDVPTLYKRY